jgi:hypothetical protein
MAPSQGAAGSIFSGVVLTNRSSSSCTVSGWPSLRYFDASGSPLATTVVRSTTYFSSQPGVPGSPSTVTVRPGATVQLALGYSDVPIGTQTSCPTVDHFNAYLPGALVASNAVSITSGSNFAPCGAGLTYVSPFYL